MKKIFLAATAFMSFACNHLNETGKTASATDIFSIEGRKAVVYITADSTNFRLTATDTLSFANFDSALETQPIICVDPSHTFQTFIGIGGALTDAAAEDFAKLSTEKQGALMQAYYDTTRGIGYTIAR